MIPEEILEKNGEVRFETFKKILAQTVPCRAAALDLRNGRATVLALRQMRYENVLRLGRELGKMGKESLD
jgi:hypothetical protein